MKCGTELSDDSQLCRQCGASLTVVTTPGNTAAAVAPAPEEDVLPPDRSRAEDRPEPKKRRLAIWFLLAILGFLIWYVAKSHSPGANQVHQVVRQERTLT